MIFKSSEIDYPAKNAIWDNKISPDCGAGDGKVNKGDSYTVEHVVITDTETGDKTEELVFWHDICAEEAGFYKWRFNGEARVFGSNSKRS